MQPPAPDAVLVAPDKFKGTLTSPEAGAAIARGLRRAWPASRIQVMPLADGGEGFAAALAAATGGVIHAMDTIDARGRACTAAWAQLGDGTTAAFDLSAAAGLGQLPPELRDPTRTSTWGSGLMLRELVRRRFPRILVGLGGSSTTDGGIGLAAAVGYEFLDAGGNRVPLTGAGLAHVQRIVPPAAPLACTVIAATDVDNPLAGPTGAAHQFARQKGASDPQIEALDAGLRHFAGVVREFTGRDDDARPGAGAAGGAGFGLIALLGAEPQSGFELLRRATGLDARLRDHALVVTGEGCLDATSAAGKAPVRLAELARSAGVPAWGVFGRVEAAAPVERFSRWIALPAGPIALAALTTADHAARVEAAAYQLATYASEAGGRSVPTPSPPLSSVEPFPPPK